MESSSSTSLRHRSKRFKMRHQPCIRMYSMPPGTTTLGDLPDLAILTIFESLPAMDLLRVNHVCRRFYLLATEVSRQKRSLSIYSYCKWEYSNDKPRDQARIKLDVLRFFNQPDVPVPDFILGMDGDRERQWTLPEELFTMEPVVLAKYPVLVDAREMIYELIVTFPRITNLTIIDAHFSPIDIIYLLARWRNTLRTVRIAMFHSGFAWDPILSCLNHLPRLRHLSLYTVGPISWNGTALRRLRSFNFGYHDYLYSPRRWCLYRLLRRLKASRVKQIGFGIFTAHSHSGLFLERNLRRLHQQAPALARRLTSLKFCQLHPHFMPFIAGHFSSLTTLDIVLTRIQELGYLSKLPQLRNLTIRSNTRLYSRCILDNITDQREELAEELPSLPCVTKLSILDFTIHPVLLHRIFPNATTIKYFTRGDTNEVDYAKENDLIDWNSLNWSAINNDNIDAILVHHRVRARELLELELDQLQ